jgi:heme/copper-type cytochrome/quinol oxidase subunit 2
MQKTRYTIIGILVVLILIGVSVYFYFYSKSSKSTSTPTSESGISPSAPAGSISLEELKKYDVPEKGEVVEENVAPPVEVAPSAPNAPTSFRLFEIRGENKEFSPKEVRVYQNDIVSIQIFAVDNDYDFEVPAYGISTRVNKGGERRVEFQATNLGKFPFVCSLCKTREQGYLIVVPKTQ